MFPLSRPAHPCTTPSLPYQNSTNSSKLTLIAPLIQDLLALSLGLVGCLSVCSPSLCSSNHRGRLLEIHHQIFFFFQFCLHWIFVATQASSSCRGYSLVASHCGGFSCCRVQALDAWAQLWHMGLAALWHVESSQTRDRTGVPCIGRWILNPLDHAGGPHHLFLQAVSNSSASARGPSVLVPSRL